MIKRFNRYELKYVIPVARSRAIASDLEQFTRPDDHGGAVGYRVVSLYYDSPGMDCFWAKVEGIKFRRKLRLRIYPGESIRSVTEGMVEIKQRVNRTVQKRRLRLPLGAAEQLCRGILPEGELVSEDAQVAAEVQYMANGMHLAPTCITAYHRIAFVGGLYDAGLRVTFDLDVRYRVHALTVNEDAVNHLVLPPDWCIMEVKVNDAVPDWMTSLIARHGCQLTRVSKYCAGIAKGRRIDVMPLVIGPGPHQEAS